MKQLPPFTTVENDAAVLVASAVAWRAPGQKGPATATELRRRAAVYKRWCLVYVATEEGLIDAADKLDAATDAVPQERAKPPKPASQAPRVGRIVVRRAAPKQVPASVSGPAVHALPKLPLSPPPLRREFY